MNEPTRFDAIIVGSGAGGAAAAHRLAVAGHSVLLLEKGAPLPRDGSTLDIRRVVHDGAFLSRERWRDGRGRALVPEEHFNVGGKTRWYGAALLRFAPEELRADPAYGCLGWPLAYEDLAPQYAEAEQLLGVRTFPTETALAAIAGRLQRHSGWELSALPLSLAATITADAHEAAHFDGFASAAGLKADAESAMLAPLAGLANLRLETHAEVVALLGSGGARPRVSGVRLADGRQFCAPVTVLAAGALHSPRLLQRFVAAHELARLLPGAALIGRYLKLHLLTALVAVAPARNHDLLRKTLLLMHRRFPHSCVQPLGFDGELISTLVPRLVPRYLARRLGERAYGFFLQTEDGSHADNRVADVEPGGQSARLFDYDERRTPVAAREHRALVRGFQLSLLRAGRPSFARRIGLSGTAHACGTLVAGRDPANSVVDAVGRVHGIEGLCVADGSALARSSRVNPALTIYAWGLRVGAHLARQLTASRGAVRSLPCARRESAA